jgi:hypothetical protein
MTELEGASMGHHPSTHTQKKKKKKKKVGKGSKSFFKLSNL